MIGLCGSMLYRNDDEKFGAVLSLLYAAGVRLAPSIRRFYSFVSKDIESSKARSVIDVGCGPGDVAIMISKRFANVYAVDPSNAMVWVAKHRGSRVRFSIGSSREIHMNRKVDLVYSSLSFHHWPDKAGSLKYLKRFLSKNGEIRIYEFRRRKGVGSAVNAHTMDMDTLRKAAYAAGLRITSIRKTKEFIRATLK